MRKKTKKQRVLQFFLVALLAIACLIGWNFIKPMISEEVVTIYTAHAVESGSISTAMSLSASVSQKRLETLVASEEATVRNLYVEVAQKVAQGDKLIQLSTGEILRAGFDGMVNEISVALNDKVEKNTVLLQVCDFDDLQVSMYVDEYDIDRISVGQKCTVSIMSLGLSFETEISHINRLSASSGYVAYYAVTADAPESLPENVMPGMQATVTIPAEEVNDVAIVDMNALGFDEEKKPYVLTMGSDGSYVQKPVEVGLNDGLYVEIKNGLSVGDLVYAISGTEKIEPAFTLQDVYNALVGTKVVINESGSARGPMSSMEGMPFDPENMPENFDAGMGEAPTGGDWGAMMDGQTENEANGNVAETEEKPSEQSSLSQERESGEENGINTDQNEESRVNDSQNIGTESALKRSNSKGLEEDNEALATPEHGLTSDDQSAAQ